MPSEAFIEQICNLPIEFRRGSKSPIRIIRESGYCEAPNELTIDAVHAFLRDNDHLIQAWLEWSQDKRVSSGWYLVCKNGEYTVGRLPDGPQLRFNDDREACAEFVVREVAAIVSNHASM